MRSALLSGETRKCGNADSPIIGFAMLRISFIIGTMFIRILLSPGWLLILPSIVIAPPFPDSN